MVCFISLKYLKHILLHAYPNKNKYTFKKLIHKNTVGIEFFTTRTKDLFSFILHDFILLVLFKNLKIYNYYKNNQY